MVTLDSLACKYKSDKGSWHHNYTPTYEKYLNPIRNSVKTVLELGVGGYEFPDKGGESLRMWKDYFPKAKIHGVDLYDKSQIEEDRIKTYIIPQDNGTRLHKLIEVIGEPDIIIDDASHINALTIASFKLLFPKLKSGGIYFIEDIETNYWADIYGGSKDLETINKETIMDYMMRMSHYLNPESTPYTGGLAGISCFIEGIHFHRGVIVITKK